VLQEKPAILDRIGAVPADVDRRVPAKPVEAILRQPRDRVVDDELANLGAVIVRARSPGRVLPPIAEEVDPVGAVALAIETGQGEITSSPVVVDHVEKDADPA